MGQLTNLFFGQPKKPAQNMSHFRAFLLKNGKILNYGKTKIGPLTYEKNVMQCKHKR